MTNQVLASGNNASNLVYGWWYPTTLTAGRSYFGNTGNSGGIKVATATDELILRVPCNTTSGDYSSTDADIAVNNWYFIAAAWVSVTGPTIDLAMWLGTMDTPPRLLSWTVTVAPAGVVNNAAGELRMGQDNVNTAAFQGLIHYVNPVICNHTASATLHPLGLSSYSAISAEEETILYERFVAPAWAGDLARLSSYGFNDVSTQVYNSHGNTLQGAIAATVAKPVLMGRGTATAINPGAITTGGTPPPFAAQAGPRHTMQAPNLAFRRR
jgi:hypothetical protein